MTAAAPPTPTARRTWLAPLLLLVTTGTLLGVSTNLAKLATDAGIPPLAFLTWSVAGAALVLSGVAAARGRLPALTARRLKFFVVSGLVSIAAPQLLFFLAIQHVGASFVALAISLPPMLTYVGALLLGLERLQAQRAAGVSLALGGAALLAYFKIAAPEDNEGWIIATLIGAALLAVSNLYRTVRWPPRTSPDQLAPGSLIASALLLLLAAGLAALLGAPEGFSLVLPTDRWQPLVLVGAQIVVFSAQNFASFSLLQLGGPVYVSLLGSIGAVVGIPIAVVLLGEAVPQGLVLGGTLVALGIALLTFGGPKSVTDASIE